jgi:hypothetical protein
MKEHLTICWLTNRRDHKAEWFLDSLHRELGGDYSGVSVIMIDPRLSAGSVNARCVPPKPSTWQGPHRLTKEDWFAACNARNTGLCFAPDGWIAYADDLSVLLPGWLQSVREAMDGNYIVCGAYQKVNGLVVERGEVKAFTPIEGCVDARWQFGQDTRAVQVEGNFLYGCSSAMPVEALLAINGWPEDLCDGLGFEDCLTGHALENAGYVLRYDRRMKTLESDELHFVETPLKRYDFGVHPNNKTHAALRIARNAKRFDNPSLGEGGIRALRAKVLAGEPFPVPTGPTHEWFTGKPLGEL